MTMWRRIKYVKQVFLSHSAFLTSCLVLLLFCCCPASGEEDVPEERGKASGERKYVVAPMVVSSPAFGNGGGLIGLYFYSFSKEDRVSPPSSVSVIGLYSDTDSYFGGGFSQNYFKEDTWRLKAGFAGGRIESTFDDPELGTAEFSTDMAVLAVLPERRVVGNLFIGLSAFYSDVSYKEGNELSEEYFEKYEVEDQSSGGGGLNLSFDTRDNQRFPYRGALAEISVNFMPEELGSEESYHVISAEANWYKQWRPGHVIALRGYGRFTPSDAPYAGLSTLGRRSDLRGYTSGEKVAENLVSAQAEYRWMFARKWGIVGFFGSAALYDGSISDVTSDDVYHSGGVGIRYVLHEGNRVNFRVDYAWGADDEEGLYVSISEAF